MNWGYEALRVAVIVLTAALTFTEKMQTPSQNIYLYDHNGGAAFRRKWANKYAHITNKWNDGRCHALDVSIFGGGKKSLVRCTFSNLHPTAIHPTTRRCVEEDISWNGCLAVLHPLAGPANDRAWRYHLSACSLSFCFSCCILPHHSMGCTKKRWSSTLLSCQEYNTHTHTRTHGSPRTHIRWAELPGNVHACPL